MAHYSMIGLALLDSLPDGLPNRKSYVYSINDPRTGQPVYFGKTAKSPRSRFGQHKLSSVYDSKPLYDWWRSIAAEGMEPVMTVLIECDSDLESRVMEAAIIGLCRLACLPILNVNKGGEGKAREDRGRCRKHGEYQAGSGCVRCHLENARESRRIRYHADKHWRESLLRKQQERRLLMRADAEFVERERKRVREYARAMRAADPVASKLKQLADTARRKVKLESPEWAEWAERRRKLGRERERERKIAKRKSDPEWDDKVKKYNSEYRLRQLSANPSSWADRRRAARRKYRCRKRAEKLASTQAQPDTVE